LAIKEPFTNFSFSRWNIGYHGAFHELLFFHDGILAIKDPFHKSRWNSGYQGAFSRITVEFWLSRSLFTNHGGILAIKEPFHMIKFTNARIGGSLFSYISQRVFTQDSPRYKTLPHDLEPPLQGKEFGPPYCNEIAEKKTIVFVPKSLIDS
jgi:hypothetical protein